MCIRRWEGLALQRAPSLIKWSNLRLPSEREPAADVQKKAQEWIDHLGCHLWASAESTPHAQHPRNSGTPAHRGDAKDAKVQSVKAS